MIEKKNVYRVPYGKAHMEFGLPPGMRGTVVTSKPVKPIADMDAAIARALAEPIDSRPLRDLAKSGHSVCIVFTDITRATPDHLLVPAILKELERAGVDRKDITLLCGTGMHRPSTPEEKAVKLGKAIVDRYRVVDHEARNPKALVDLGMTESGIPLSVNRLAHEADLIIATGIVEPHQYAGYSGGGKTLAIGAGGESVIAYTHGPHMVDHPGTRLGKIEGNPFQEAVTEASRRAGLRFIINVVQDDEKRPVAVLAGHPETAYRKLVAAARDLFEVPIPHQYDVAVAGVGFPKDANLYQASRAVSYLFFAPTPVVKEGGLFILPASTPEGVGQGAGEVSFFEKMRGAADMPSLLADLRRTGYPPGAQRAFVMAKVLEKNDVIVVGSETPDVVRQLKMIAAATMDEAFQIASDRLSREDLDVLIVPHALLTLPIVGGRK
ncbi:MAG: nickel-dependent lactate racemase [Desulfobacterales bacterium]|nr:nickel-dependent lactate racemase [Desulfobacterales bacterium]